MGLLIFLCVIIVVCGVIKWGLITYAIGTSLFCGGHKVDSGWSCPHGYDSFACQPECPLYEHCWGSRDVAD